MFEVNWHLSSLPPELWDYIILWFSWLDILAFRRTCRFLNHASRSKSLWTSLVNRYLMESRMGHHLEVHPGLCSQADLEGWLWKRIGSDIGWAGGHGYGYAPSRRRAASASFAGGWCRGGTDNSDLLVPSMQHTDRMTMHHHQPNGARKLASDSSMLVSTATTGPVRQRLMEQLPRAEITHLVSGGRWLVGVSTGKECAMYAYDLEYPGAGYNPVLLDRMEDFDGGNLIVSDVDYFEKQGATSETLAFRLALCRSAVQGRSIVGIWEIRLVLLQGHARLLAKRVASRAIEGDNRYTGCLALSGRRLARFVVGPSSHDHGSFIEVVNWKSMSNIRARGYLISSERFVEGIALLPEDKLVTYGKTTTVYHLREAIEIPDGGLPHPLQPPSISLWYQTFPTSPRLSQRPAAILATSLATTAILPFPDESKIRCITIPRTLYPMADTTPVVDEFKGMDLSGPGSFCTRRAFIRQYWAGDRGVLLDYAFRHVSDPMAGVKVVLDGVEAVFAVGMADAPAHDALPELDEASGRVVICAPGRIWGTSSVQVLDFSVYYRRYTL